MNRIDNKKELKENNIWVFDDFLNIKKCNEILFTINHDCWEPSTLGRLDEANQYNQYYSEGRTSRSYHYYNFNHKFQKYIDQVQHKIIQLTNLEATQFEYWQISGFRYGEKFDYHNDCGCHGHEAAGEREKTILIYLSSPSRGGETHFRALNLYVKPLQGRLVIWDNLLPNGNCNYAKIHAGLPVKEGIKVTLNNWVRQRKFKK